MVNPVSSQSPSLDAEEGMIKQTVSGVNRKARTSAAMIGLALSMGASSLLLPRQDDGAIAAEPVANSVTAVVPQAALPGGMVEHVMREGQTLWHLSRAYHVPVSVIARANGISVNDSIRAGQVIRIPAQPQSATANRVVASRNVITPNNASAQASVPSSALDDASKAGRVNSIERMRQERQKLRSRLSEMRSVQSSDTAFTDTSKSHPEGYVQTERLNNTRMELSSDADKPSVSPAEASVANLEPANLDAQSSATYRVKPGDTLGAIALNYDIPQDQLAYVNRLADPNQLQVDQVLTVPQYAPLLPEPVESTPETIVPVQPASSAAPTTHRVARGETVAEIARRNNVPLESLIALNRLDNPNFILVGQMLRIPASAASQTLSTTPTTAVDNAPIAVALDSATSRSAASHSVASQLMPEQPSTVVPALTQLPDAVAVPTVPMAADRSSLVSSAVTPEVPTSGAMFSTEFVGVSAPAETESTNVAAVAPADSVIVPSSEASAQGEITPFMDNLITEIDQLRSRNAASVAAAEPTAQPSPAIAVVPTSPVAALTTPPEASSVNPEFDPERASAALQRQTAAVQSGSTVESSSQVVAVAPLGSESYRPLLQPITGQVVSPDLPPLPNAEAYLPNGVNTFNGYAWPAHGVLTSGYGWRWGRMHRGIDIGAPVGTPVFAAADGVVETSGWNSGGYGNMVEIRHADGSMTRYAHHSRNLVRVGQRVRQGEQIAEVGSTGYSTGPHLHFEVHLPSQGTVNPIAYLPR
ncbi:MAG TPA: LysM peptidoglycan-binding domain-containing protein [Chroococcidiopsis sp.]